MNRTSHATADWKAPALAGLVLVCTAAFLAAAPAVILDGYAARVNDRVITIGQVLSYIQPEIAALPRDPTDPRLGSRMAAAFDRGLEELVQQALLLEYAEEKKMELPDQAIEQEVARIVKERFNDDQTAFREALQEEHRTFEEWKKELKDNLLAMMVRRYLLQDAGTVTPEEILQYYRSHIDEFRLPEQVRVAIITIQRADDPTGASEADKRAAALEEKLAQGADFSELAKEFSDDAWSDSGGDRGWLQPDDLRPALADAVRQLKPGETSNMIKTTDSYYLIKLLGRREAGIKPLDQAYDQIRNQLRKQKMNRAYENLIKRLRNRYYVEVLVQGDELFGQTR